MMASRDVTQNEHDAEHCPCLAVDVMVVIGNEKLTIEMQKMFTKNGVTVISAPKSGGVSLSRAVSHAPC